MNKELDALLNGGLALFSGVFLGCVLLNFVVQTEAKLVHHMYVPNITIAGNTEVKIITLPAVVPCLHMHAAVVAGVHKAITGLVVKLIQHGHGGGFRPAE